MSVWWLALASSVCARSFVASLTTRCLRISSTCSFLQAWVSVALSWVVLIIVVRRRSSVFFVVGGSSLVGMCWMASHAPVELVIVSSSASASLTAASNFLHALHFSVGLFVRPLCCPLATAMVHLGEWQSSCVWMLWLGLLVGPVSCLFGVFVLPHHVVSVVCVRCLFLGVITSVCGRLGRVTVFICCLMIADITLCIPSARAIRACCMLVNVCRRVFFTGRLMLFPSSSWLMIGNIFLISGLVWHRLW